jgi:ribosome-associated protein
MIEVTEEISIADDEIHLDYVRASGPGGQKVNKTSTAVQLRFDVRNSPSLSDVVRDRLIQIGGKRVTDDGVLIIEASRFRSQEENRQDAISRLVELVRDAAQPPKERKGTRPTTSSKRKRLQEKKKRSEKKRLRKRVDLDE